MIRSLFIALGCLLASVPISAAQTRQVALELVLAVDTSTSVDEREFRLQRDGLAQAFAHPDIVSAIEGMGNVGIAVTLIEWAGKGQQDTIVDWTLLNNKTSVLNFASKVSQAPRAFSGMTDIGGGIAYAVEQIEDNAFEGYRKVIDVSGDGSSSVDTSQRQRDRAIASGITINGLVIFTEEYDLGVLAEIDLIQHYSNKVIGGPGAFLMTAQNFESFEIAIKNKLLREILGGSIASLE